MACAIGRKLHGEPDSACAIRDICDGATGGAVSPPILTGTCLPLRRRQRDAEEFMAELYALQSLKLRTVRS